ncbi:High-affinity branched-chain amino acid transport ATP-binding protein LivF [Saezia sanguinis]|uniref:High-affinity branched-chain amino acid transport ATP-binding protein LivF n=1 Tax=Saezia sanguinis TaxID=1965230 RepID=A0A433SFJ7_9BURK|nr:ABC transporter ATP-binding protein [Saezia sanguinis]RUS67490.1 High-affinity branched-chain amino acid transport ATP-binding protein LivF [Saezia sanguinis]
MLEIRGLRAGYGSVEVLRGIDLDVRKGELVAVLGSNGVGKTTLNMVLSGILKASAGNIMFNGQPLGKDSSKVVTSGLIHVPEGRKIFPNMSVLENLELGSFLRASERMHQNLEHVFDVFPRLRERMDQNAGTLSGGEQQMLAIGRGLMAEPLFLILDEPSLGLSPLLVEEMFNLIKRLNDEGMTIMLVEQNVIQSLELASRAYIIENGEVAISGDAQTVMNDPELQRTYLGL